MEYVVGSDVTVTGRVTASTSDPVKGDSVTVHVAAPVFHEYPKMIEPGVIANSRQHEAELKSAPEQAKRAAEQAAKDKAKHDKVIDAEAAKAQHEADKAAKKAAEE